MSDQDAQLLAHVLHDLKNPLSVILCYAEIVPDAKDAERREYCERMRSNARVLLELLDGFALLSDLRAGHPQASRQRCDWIKVVMTVTADLAPIAMLRDQRLACETVGAGDMLLDRNALMLAVRHLGLEAMRVAPVGSTLRIRALRDSDGASVRIEFAPPAGTGDLDIARLFDLNRPGIELVQRVAALHGGSVTFAIEHGAAIAGMQFTLT